MEGIGLKLLISFGLGAVIGLERQVEPRDDEVKKGKIVGDLGLRTFALIAGLGTLLGTLMPSNPLVFVILSTAFFALLIAYYIFGGLMTKDIGITTEIAVFYTFLIGILIAIEVIPMQVLLAVVIVVTTILSRKERIHNFIAKIERGQMNAFISYAIIALVILPFLPNESYSLSSIPNTKEIFESLSISKKLLEIELFNPFKLWTIVALITGVDVAGYILERTIGSRKGWVLASMAGGFISSTATTLSLAQKSKTARHVGGLVGAALLANMTSFFEIGVLIAVINSAFFVKALPFLGAIITASLIPSIYFLKKDAKRQKGDPPLPKKHTIFNIVPALKFAGLFTLISIVSKVLLEFFGEKGFLLASAVGAISGVDAVTINTSQLAGGKIDYSIAILALIIANAVNLLTKTGYSYFNGKKAFTLQFGIGVGVIVLASLIGLIIKF